MDLWEQTRAKLAQLLPHNKLTELSTYYRKAQVLNNLLDPHTSPNTRRRDIPTVVNDLAQRGSTVQLWIQDDYIGQAG
jgi:hypothetical protein